MLALKQYRSRKRGFSDLLNSAAMVEDGIVLNKDGSLMAAWSYDGPDTESATALERDHLSAQLNAILARLGTGYMLHVDAIRTPAVSYPSPDRSFFPDPITRLIDDERRQHFQSAGTFFESRHVLVLTYNPPDLRASKVASMMYTETGGRRRGGHRRSGPNGRLRPLHPAPQLLHHGRRSPDRAAPDPDVLGRHAGD
jgi:type IV secretory pathway VirB4 component